MMMTPIRLVIADDHAVFRSGLRALLERENDFEVVGETGSGEEAIQLAGSVDFDLLLLDIGMPDLAGPRVAEQVLAQQPDLGIVVLTMYEQEDYLRELLEIGARGYVLKKSTGQELGQAIRAVHRGDSYIDPAMAPMLISPYVGRKGNDREDQLSLLTSREKEVCRLLAFGYTNSEVAEQLCISTRTVETHRNNIMGKLDMRGRAELVRFAIDNGLLKTD